MENGAFMWDLNPVLQQHGYYRNNVRYDTSCLFRAISLHVYGTDHLHIEIRQMCVQHMRRNNVFFRYLIDENFEEYLTRMGNVDSLGTFIELQSLGHMFQRNIVIFESTGPGKYYNPHAFYTRIFVLFHDQGYFDALSTTNPENITATMHFYTMLYNMLFPKPDCFHGQDNDLWVFEEHYYDLTKLDAERSAFYRIKTNDNGYPVVPLEFMPCSSLNMMHFHQYQIITQFNWSSFPNIDPDIWEQSRAVIALTKYFQDRLRVGIWCYYKCEIATKARLFHAFIIKIYPHVSQCLIFIPILGGRCMSSYFNLIPYPSVVDGTELSHDICCMPNFGFAVTPHRLDYEYKAPICMVWKKVQVNDIYPLTWTQSQDSISHIISLEVPIEMSEYYRITVEHSNSEPNRTVRQHKLVFRKCVVNGGQVKYIYRDVITTDCSYFSSHDGIELNGEEVDENPDSISLFDLC